MTEEQPHDYNTITCRAPNMDIETFAELAYQLFYPYFIYRNKIFQHVGGYGECEYIKIGKIDTKVIK